MLFWIGTYLKKAYICSPDFLILFAENSWVLDFCSWVLDFCSWVLVFFAFSFHETVQMTSLIWIVLDILEYLQLGGGLSRKLRQSLVEGHHSAMFHVVAGRAETLFGTLKCQGWCVAADGKTGSYLQSWCLDLEVVFGLIKENVNKKVKGCF